VKRIHLLRLAGPAEGATPQAGPEELRPLFEAARAAGLRIGWLDLTDGAGPSSERAPAPRAPETLESASEAGAFRAVAAGGGRVVSVKAKAGPPVLGDLLREHFLGCALVVIRGRLRGNPGGSPEPDEVPRLEPAAGGWRVTPPGLAARELTADELVARLRRPRPWD
jgi:hypothetical protein